VSRGADVHGLTRAAPRRLAGVDIHAAPGEIVAVIGASGAGKSTLLEVLTGLLPATGGAGRVAGSDVLLPADHRSGRIGYVPQFDALHGELTVRQEFAAGARLRAADPRAVPAVLRALGLGELAERRIEHLSGGERKRVSVGLELLAAPEVLVLDEPTTGLDPGHERELIEYLRRLADAGCAIVLSTHSTVYLGRFDRLVLLGSGGRALFAGTPDEALAAVGSESFVDLFAVTVPLVPPEASAARRQDESAAGQPRRARRRGVVATLVLRDVQRLAGDRRTLAFVTLQAPVLGLIVRLIAGDDGLAVGDFTNNLYARRMVVTLVMGAVWLGATNTVRELVRDRATMRRERVAGVRPGQVLAAKSLVLWALSGVQSLVFVLIATAGLPTVGEQSVVGSVHLAVFVGLWLCTGASGCLALLVSALVRRSEQALAVLPILLIPQLVLSGGMLALRDVPVLSAVSYVSPARWGMSATASAVDLRALETTTVVAVPVDDDQYDVGVHQTAERSWDPTAGAWLLDLGALAALAAACTGATAFALRRT
jgi:ABC-type multidrug transport system ATPase subunit